MASKTDLTGPVLRPAYMAHVVLKTPNFKAMVAFYKAFLGAHASYENEQLAFLTYDEEHHRIALVSMPFLKVADSPLANAGMDHTAFTYLNLRDYVTAYKQRKARGILPAWSVNHGPTTSMYYQDPDGNKIEIQVDAFATNEETNEYIMGPEFQENSIGVDFDPEELVRRVESGEDEKEILKRPKIGPRGIDSVPMPGPPVIRESYEPIAA